MKLIYLKLINRLVEFRGVFFIGARDRVQPATEKNIFRIYFKIKIRGYVHRQKRR